MKATTAAEAFVVLKANTPAGSVGALWEFGNTGNTAYPDASGDIVDDFGSTSDHTLSNLTQSLNLYHVYEVAGQTKQWSAWIDGTLQYQTNYNIYGFNSSPTLGYCNGYSFAGDVEEMLVLLKMYSSTGFEYTVNGVNG